MYIDALGLVSDSQALTATGFSTNTVDLSNATIKRQIGTGVSVGFGVNVDVAADFTTTDETYTVEIVQSDNANLSTPDVLSSTLLSAAQRAIGTLLFVPIPIGQPTKRYIGLRYTLAGTTPSITVTAWLGEREMFSVPPVHYAKNYSV